MYNETITTEKKGENYTQNKLAIDYNYNHHHINIIITIIIIIIIISLV